MNYAIFAGFNDRPLGGIDDLKGTYLSLAVAKDHAKKMTYDWWQLVDLRTMEVINRNDS